MKKKVVIVIDIDTEEMGISASGPVITREGEPETYSIIVRDDEHARVDGQQNYLATYLHEMGHVTGAIFGLPGNTNDPRQGPASGQIFSRLTTKGVMESENEAWQIGQQLFDSARRNSMNTYAQNFDLQSNDPHMKEIRDIAESPIVRHVLRERDKELKKNRLERVRAASNEFEDWLKK